MNLKPLALLLGLLACVVSTPVLSFATTESLVPSVKEHILEVQALASQFANGEVAYYRVAYNRVYKRHLDLLKKATSHTDELPETSLDLLKQSIEALEILKK